MDDVFRAIADPVRRMMLVELADRNDQTLFELCVRLLDRGASMSRQAVSKHITVLRDAGLVSATSRGRTTVHHLDTSALADVSDWIELLTTREQR